MVVMVLIILNTLWMLVPLPPSLHAPTPSPSLAPLSLCSDILGLNATLSTRS